ncbi:hypothetical protein PIROE2DRAFT_2384 [Piromyces sp. E2]|nr:hypothetical protein PIROE2DRAFT_2384 [Piromyces sp. E2]|eukprot:OUM69736.1 hypothetical protein PIROE2DRAFT_2384 [Piromyces sp. E2]
MESIWRNNSKFLMVTCASGNEKKLVKYLVERDADHGAEVKGLMEYGKDKKYLIEEEAKANKDEYLMNG